MASKEFVIAALFDLSQAFGTDENKKRANINLQPSGCYRLRHSTLILSNHLFARIAGSTVVKIRMSDIASSSRISLSFSVTHGTNY